MDSSAGDQLSEKRRNELLERISRRTSTIGERIPEEVQIGEQTIALRSFVWETKKQGVVPPDKRESVREVRTKLRRERDRLKERLATDQLSTTEAESLADTIVGVDRAIDALKRLRDPDLGQHAHDEYIASNKRWMNFINQLL